MFKIEKGIELPKRRAPAARSSAYPFEQMEPGDSFFVPDRKHFTSHNTFARRRTGWKFASRREGTGVRVWCLQRPPKEAPKLADLPVRTVRQLDQPRRAAR